MKKYSKLIVLFIITIVTFSVFYMNMQTLAKSLPQFVLKKIEGDEAAIDSVVIKGDLFSSSLTQESFKLTKSGFKYTREEPFITRLDYYTPNYIKQLQKEKRSFMRGKSTDVDAFAEIDETVYYANIPYTRWGILKGYIELDTYNRETNETTTHKIKASNLSEYAHVQKVIPQGDEVAIAVFNYTYNAETDIEESEMQLYIYNLESEILVDTITFNISNNNKYSDFTNTLVDNDLNPTELIVTGALVDYEEVPQETELNVIGGEDVDYKEYIELNSIQKINLETKEKTEITIPDHNKMGLPIAFNGKEIVFVTTESKKAIYSIYDITSKTIKDKLTIDIDMEYVSLWDFESNVIKDNKVFTILNNEYGVGSVLIVIDANNVELLYKGVIENVNENYFGIDNIEAYFHTLELTD